MTKKEAKEIMAVKIDYTQKGMFFIHCASCLKDYNAGTFGAGQSPAEAFSYCLSSYPFTMPNGEIHGIMVVWCKRCDREVWDSRHLTNAF